MRQPQTGGHAERPLQKIAALTSRGRIHVGRIGYPPPTLPSRIRPLNKKGAVGVIYAPCVAIQRLAVKRSVAYPAVMNTAPGDVFWTA